MRHALMPLAILSLFCGTAPVTAQAVAASAPAALHQRAAMLNGRIDVAVRAGRLSRSRAAALHTAVGRVQTSAGNSEARDGAISPREFDRLDRQLAAVEAAVPGKPAEARGTPSQRAANARATAAMRARIAGAITRVETTERHGRIAPARSAALRRQLAQAQGQMAQLSRGQGFVSAAELATYDRMIAGVDAELGAGGRAHS